MKKQHFSVKSFFSMISFCLKLSWKSSALYTSMRVLGKIIIPASAIASTFLLKYVIDILSGSYTVSDDRLALVVLICSITVISILKAIMQKAVTYAEGLHNDIIERYITTEMMEKTLSADISLFDNPKYYDKLMSVRSDSYAMTYILWNSIDSVSSAVTFISTFAILCAANPIYGILMAIVAFPSAVTGKKYTKILYQLSLSQINDERRKGYIYNMASSKRHAQDIRLLGIGDYLKQRYSTLWNTVFSKKKKQIKAKTILTTIFDFLPELVILLITLGISFSVLNGTATIGDYSLYTGLLSQLWNAIYMLTNSIISIYENKLKIDNVMLFDKIQKNVADNGTVKLDRVQTIEFSHVVFSYPQSEYKALNDISFKIENGEHAALVGINGSGKSTVIKLLLRFYDAADGDVLINGKNIKEYTLKSLRSCFGCYFQNSENFGFTLRENIILADISREASDSDVETALYESNAENILKKAPDGLDAYITREFDDNGIELSGGENQKIALARTFYRNAGALVLDEPSSSLDPEAEHCVFCSLEKICKGKTALFTSHRLSNVNMADKIIVIENGAVIEQGTLSELLKTPNRFAELYNYQAEKFNGR